MDKLMRTQWGRTVSEAGKSLAKMAPPSCHQHQKDKDRMEELKT